MVDPAKIAVIMSLEVLRSVKQLRTTLGYTGYYRKFIKSYAQITAPMEKLLKKDVTFCWNNDCKKSLDILKENMVIVPILVFPNWNKELHVQVNASCIALGTILTQDDEERLDHPITFASCRLSKEEKNYSTTECEGLAMVWILLFQEYDFEDVVKPRQLNAGPDHLSRVETWEEPTNLEEGLPDVQLLVVCVTDVHFEDIIHFLTTRIVLEGYYVQQKKELVVHTADFSVISMKLYTMGTDQILRRYVPKFERRSILVDSNGGTTRGNNVGRATA
eukprot:PITA_03898